MGFGAAVSCVTWQSELNLVRKYAFIFLKEKIGGVYSLGTMR